MADIPIGDLRVVSVDLLVETLLRLQKELRELRAERDGLMQTLRDEIDENLHMIEKTPQPVSAAEPAENSFEWFQLEIQRLQHHVTETWPDWMQRTSGLSTATFPTVGAVEVPMPEENILKIRALDSAEVRWIGREALRTYGDAREAAGYAAGVAAGGKDAERLLINVSRCEKTFSWDGEKKEHIPKLILEFHPVPMNSPYDAKGWVDRNALDAAIDAALRGEVKP